MRAMLTLSILIALGTFPGKTTAEVGKVEEVVPGVYFRQGELEHKGHCNNAWIIFEDYVVVMDANFPDGAEEVLPEIRRTTSKPIRFVVDTHHHGDHAYGNIVWVWQGAVPVAQENVLAEIQRYEPQRWQEAIQQREDVRKLGLPGPKPPTLLYPDRMIFDDGKRRLELHYFGVAHTRGDTIAFLPKEKVLITGDACVNGPYNYMGDGNSESWVRVLEAMGKLDFEIVAPGHGPLARNGRDLLAGQKEFFLELRRQVRQGVDDKKSLAEVKSAVKLPDRVKAWVGDFLPAQIEQVYKEMTGQVSLPTP
jgi:glyoxylase-like metal-dependent hydrolase (beta-lactamase superfamily II)